MKHRDAVFHADFREDLLFWIRTNRKLSIRLLRLIEDIMRDPFDGIGKPEPLKYLDPNTWSRRLTQTDRIVYFVEDDRVTFLQARFHYRK
ncbi:MAG: Txe/YoeB family addiction module toxin [Candidatus Promineifilaceae bacterium]